MLVVKLTADDPDFIPKYGLEHDAGCDLKSRIDCTIDAGERAVVPTGISVEIPAGFAGLILPRSGLAKDYGITCLNSPGLIDSGYRGEIKVLLFNTDLKNSFRVAKGDRIAQMLIIEHPNVKFARVDKLSESERGERGFGSTGI